MLGPKFSNSLALKNLFTFVNLLLYLFFNNFSLLLSYTSANLEIGTSFVNIAHIFNPKNHMLFFDRIDK